MSESIRQTGPLWRWTGANGVSWFFVSFEGEASEAMSAHEAMRRLEFGRKRGFRSLKVTARIGKTQWQTSCFPGDAGEWLLPVKAQVRKAEGLEEGAEVTAQVTPV